MIIRARWVVTMDGPLIDDGAVIVEGRKIRSVGRYRDLCSAAPASPTVDLGEMALLPGLINAQCHLDYTVLRGAIPRQPSFADWIRAINRAKAALNEDEYARSIAQGFEEAAAFGTTSILNVEAFPAMSAATPASKLRTWWCAEMIDVRQPVVPANVVAQLDVSGAHFNGGIGVAPHAPYTASAELYAASNELARRRELILTTHLAESREEMEMFRDARGALFEFIRSIGRATDDCGRCTPLVLMLRRGILDERWIVAHLNELSADDLRQLACAPKFHIVHCPRSHAYFGHARFKLAELRGLGFNISLGTDSLASNDDLSLMAEMRQLWRIEPSLSARDRIAMATLHAAAALRRDEALGRIRSGFLADLIAVPCSKHGGDVYQQVVQFEQKVPWSMIDGTVVTGQ